MSREQSLLKIKNQLKKSIVQSSIPFPKRFVYITDCFQHFVSLDEIKLKTGFSNYSFEKCVHRDLGVIYDPVASLIHCNKKKIRLHEAKIKGIERV